MKTIQHIINGKSTKSFSTQTQAVYNPATGEQTAKLVLGGSDDINAAVENSKQAFETWSATPAAKRGRIMFNLRDILLKRADAVAITISKEHGKTHDDALGE
ncbi:MAG: aldehyde dehydrogenase family protein, partial [Proteobacteria bacterium]|nr:aldehyde dehydrogenase family protein [Pseudomonadota bacterium]